MSNIATSSKRALPSSSSTPSAKRPRPSTSSAESSHHDEEMDEDDVGPIDETLKEKLARKDARTIRNRESAQRSRNQRKAHLAWLEVRVVELEEENRRLRSGPSGSTTLASNTPKSAVGQVAVSAPSPLAEGSPSLFSLDLGSSGPSLGGINLAAVAPPPPGVKLEECPVTSADALQIEVASLRARNSHLEGLVKHMMALSNLGAGIAEPVSVAPPPLPSAMDIPPLDWDSIFIPQPTDSIAPVNSSTFSQPSSLISPTLYTLSTPQTTIDTTQQSSPDLLACHPAAVATPPVQTEGSLQRARTDSGLILGMSAAVHRGGFRGMDTFFSFAGPNQGMAEWTNQEGSGEVRPAENEWSRAELEWDEGMIRLLADLEGEAGGVQGETVERGTPVGVAERREVVA
ncbi:uncharacterized protein MKK02DRAFT_44074 [Dioszegia hungarica]|uniref:BZIP domain-containing protein n=1 Tax=Dioszegia hungarica TaxID=4972 RepID=A0AA38LVJ2_9TREE|nr:uncharacterized protein MKK02DRAFT_44074 [Dioszegia hungarica]KAI9635386.1 hypothetical protein MKK02DRAFT_44074 [Dioszegia hungarica]